MFIARHGPHTPSAVWGGLINGFVACEIQSRPPQTAEKPNASDASIIMSLLTELLPELFHQAIRRYRHGLARQWATGNNEEPFLGSGLALSSSFRKC